MSDTPVHKLVKALVPNPKDPPDLVMLNGFFGPSTKEGCQRLYRTLKMNIWQDLPEGQIVYVDQVRPGPNNPWGEDVVWMLRKDAMALPLGMSRRDGQDGHEGTAPDPSENGDQGEPDIGDPGFTDYRKIYPPS